MKRKWSNAWKSSKQRRKQRKYRYNAPLHVRQKFIHAHLSPELRKEIGTRSIGLRKGDEVKVLRGTFKGKRGKVSRIDLKRVKVFVDGIKREKSVGGEVSIALEPSNLMIIGLNKDDKKRLALIKRKKK